MSDYYTILGIERNATDEEIRNAYRTKALVYHPDRNASSPLASSKKFKEISAAFEVLNNPEKRAKYDQDGYVGRRPPGYRRPKSSPPPPPFPPAPPTSNDPRIPTKENLEKVDCTFQNIAGTGRTILTHLYLQDNQRRDGGSFLVRIKRRVVCMICVGDGCYDEQCPHCIRGRGLNYGCPQCNWEGAISKKCEACDGKGVNAWEIKDIRMKVPANTQVGQTILVAGEGEYAPRKPPGNLKVVIMPKKSPTW